MFQIATLHEMSFELDIENSFEKFSRPIQIFNKDREDINILITYRNYSLD